MTIEEARSAIKQHWNAAPGQSSKDLWEMLSIILDIIEQRTGGSPQDDVAVLKAKIAELDSLLNNDASIFQAIKNALGRDDLTAAQLPAEIKLLMSWHSK